MKRLFDNLFIDFSAAALMVGMAATGYILRFPLPPQLEQVPRAVGPHLPPVG
jgi:hypothetical protein